MREYYQGYTLEFTGKDFDRLTDCKIKWDIVPAGEGLPLNTEMRGGSIWLKELQLNLTSIFCLLEKGDLHWRQDFPLTMITGKPKIVQDVITEIPSSIEAYSCEDPDTKPAAQVSLYEIDDCNEDQFNNYRKKGVKQVTILHRLRTKLNVVMLN